MPYFLKDRFKCVLRKSDEFEHIRKYVVLDYFRQLLTEQKKSKTRQGVV